MDLAIVFSMAAVVPACLFPAYLVNAIRAQSSHTAHKNKLRACACFGLLVLLSLTSIHA